MAHFIYLNLDFVVTCIVKAVLIWLTNIKYKRANRSLVGLCQMPLKQT